MINDKSIYRDIAKRTGGDMYIGVVGPVRTGKSTFIKKFMEAAVIPNIRNKYGRKRATDETPQSASGRTVTTTEPKFVPDEAAELSLDGKTKLRVRLVDCVGYIVPGAIGIEEEGAPRMVHTPWSENAIPFKEAAEIGTRKVISEHSTIGIMVTTDGTISDIPREDYVQAEREVIAELNAAKKPYAIILNSAHPEAQSAIDLAYELEKQYGAPVALVNCTELDEKDIGEILGMILEEFPVCEISFSLPDWIAPLPEAHWLKTALLSAVDSISSRIAKMGDLKNALLLSGNEEYVEKWELSACEAGTGKATVTAIPQSGLYYRVLSELTGLDIENDAALTETLCHLAAIKREYDKVESALHDVETKGYGIVMPTTDELHLSQPEIVRMPGGYGVRLKASAASVHMIKANIETTLSPMVGSEAQSEEILQSLLADYSDAPEELWNSNMFGKSLYELVNEGINTKLAHISDDSRVRLSETLERIVNEGSKGLICILL